MKYYQNFKNIIHIDIRDVLFFSGLLMLGCGLFLWSGAWLALVVCGPLFSATGYLMKDVNPEDKKYIIHGLINKVDNLARDILSLKNDIDMDLIHQRLESIESAITKKKGE